MGVGVQFVPNCMMSFMDDPIQRPHNPFNYSPYSEIRSNFETPMLTCLLYANGYLVEEKEERPAGIAGGARPRRVGGAKVAKKATVVFTQVEEKRIHLSLSPLLT